MKLSPPTVRETGTEPGSAGGVRLDIGRKFSVRSHRSRSHGAHSKSSKVEPWHQLHGDDVARLLNVDLRTGLTNTEVKVRQNTHGFNRLSAQPGTPGWLRFLRQFNQPLVYLLLVAAVVTAFLREWVDSGVIFGVVLINAIVGYLQESKATSAIAALSRMITSVAMVRREGQIHRVATDELVPGDVVILEPGDRVGADLRLFQVKGLRIDESTLTGESLPVAKHPDPLALDTVLADRKNLAFAGTLVTSGVGEGVVWATGDRTETGRIAWLISEAVNLSTPLTRKITRFSQILLWAILVLAAVTFAVGVARGEPAVEVFMAAVALSVGAIPEGLPAAVTIVLAIGVSRMARRGAVIRKLPAVETLGSTTVICSDKTGTLTENQMTVREVFAAGDLFEATGTGYDSAGEFRRGTEFITMAKHAALGECLKAGVLCNDSRVTRQEGKLEIHGDPTELALLIAGEKGGFTRAKTHRDSPRLDSIPFESVRMYRATLHEAGAARMIYKVGAVERVLERCSHALDRNGALVPVDKAAVLAAVIAMASRGLRVLACARREVKSDHATLEHSHVAEGLTFLGLQGMIDPPRREVVTAVRHCREAGVAVKMITGDHLVTARAIAEQIGLVGRGDSQEPIAVSGRELDNVSDADLPDLVERTAVFARVEPEQKLRLVRALQSRGHVVAMTGDGVNDAPALRQADIGVAMGISGTEVAKSAADMVLTDDNFATIEAAVEEGRGVFDNLTKFIVWTLPTNAGEASILLVSIVLGVTLPALPVQLLWVNLATAVLLGLMLVFEPKETGLMQRPPRDPARPLLTVALVMRTLLVTLVMLAGAFWLFAWEYSRAGETIAEARTAVINVIVMVEIAYLFSCRSLKYGVFAGGFFRNRWAFVGAFGMVGAQLLFTYWPVMNRLFHTAPINGESWLRIVGVAATVFTIVEFEKWVRYGHGRGAKALPE